MFGTCLALLPTSPPTLAVGSPSLPSTHTYSTPPTPSSSSSLPAPARVASSTPDLLALANPDGSPAHPGGYISVFALPSGLLLGTLAPEESYLSLFPDPTLRFGAALAWNQESSFLAVGIPGYNPGGTPNAGAVVVLESSDPLNSWAPPQVTSSAILTPPGGPLASRLDGAMGHALTWVLSVGRLALLVGEPAQPAAGPGRLHVFFVGDPRLGSGVDVSQFSPLAVLSPFTPSAYSSPCGSVAGGTESRTGAVIVSELGSGIVAISANPTPSNAAVVCVFRPQSDPSTSTLGSFDQVAGIVYPSSLAYGAPGSLLFRWSQFLYIGFPSADALTPPARTASGAVAAYYIPGMGDYSLTMPVTSAEEIEVLAPPGAHADNARFGSQVVASSSSSSSSASSSSATSRDARLYISAPGLPSPEAGVNNTGAVFVVETKYCPTGLVLSPDGTCVPCPSGEISSSGLNAGTCTPCNRGLYASDDQTQCLPCPAGTANSLPRGASEEVACLPCEPGSFANETGSSLCLLCRSETYQPANSSSVCLACPLGGDCRALGVATPRALPGYYRDTSKPGLVFMACAPPASRCLGNNECAPGWAGEPACSDCATGYYLKQDYLTDPQCSACPRYIMAYVAGIVLIVLVVSVTLVKLARSATVFMTSIGVGLNFVQTVAVLSTFDAGWPAQTQRSLNYMTLFNLNLELFSIECVRETGLGPGGKLIAKLGLPFLFLLIFLTMYISVRIYYACRLSSVQKKEAASAKSTISSGAHSVAVASNHGSRARTLEKSAKTWEWAVINAALAMLNLIYISITLTCMEVFDCEDEDGDGVFRIRAQPDVDCYTDEWRGIRNTALAGGVFYGLGIPFLFFILLKKKSHKLHRRSAVLQLGLLYRKFTKYAYLWELVIILRKIVLVGVKLFASQLSQVSRMQTVLLAFVMFFLLQLILKPYQSRRANRLELFTLICVIGVLICGLFFQKALLTTPSETQEFLVGYVVIGIVGAALVAIIFVVAYDFRNARRMKARGMVGAYATEDVQVYPHFFRSGVRMASECRMVTTTDHFSNLMIAYSYDVYTRTPRPVIEVRGASRTRFGNVRSSRFEGAVQIQHNKTENLYVISVLFPESGNYILRFAGGIPLEAPSGCCTRRLTERAREERESMWHPKRVLMDYALVVTDAAATGPRQSFAEITRLRQVGGLLFSPVEQYLVEGPIHFRLKIPHAHGVVVIQDGGASETHLIKERRRTSSSKTGVFHDDTYSGDVPVSSGRVTVVAFMRDDTLEAAMAGGGRDARAGSSRHSRGGELQTVQLLEYEVVAEGQGVQSPSGGTVNARSRARARARSRARTLASTGGIHAPNPDAYASHHHEVDNHDTYVGPEHAYDFGGGGVGDGGDDGYANIALGYADLSYSYDST